MPQIEIRPAAPSDIPHLIAIDHSNQSSHVWQIDISGEEGQITVNFREIRLPRPAKVDYPRRPELLLTDWNARGVILVGVLEDQPVGYISLSEGIAPTTAWVTDLAVAVEARRKGIASGLVLAGQEWASERRNRRVVLEIQSKNIAAIRMVQKLGYEFCGYNDHYYENQDIALFFAQYVR